MVFTDIEDKKMFTFCKYAEVSCTNAATSVLMMAIIASTLVHVREGRRGGVWRIRRGILTTGERCNPVSNMLHHVLNGGLGTRSLRIVAAFEPATR